MCVCIRDPPSAIRLRSSLLPQSRDFVLGIIRPSGTFFREESLSEELPPMANAPLSLIPYPLSLSPPVLYYKERRKPYGIYFDLPRVRAETSFI